MRSPKRFIQPIVKSSLVFLEIRFSIIRDINRENKIAKLIKREHNLILKLVIIVRDVK